MTSPRLLAPAALALLTGCAGLQLTKIDAAYQPPSNVAVFFTVCRYFGIVVVILCLVIVPVILFTHVVLVSLHIALTRHVNPLQRQTQERIAVGELVAVSSKHANALTKSTASCT